MSHWDKMTEEEKKRKYADMAMTLDSLTKSGDLDEFVEEDKEKGEKE